MPLLDIFTDYINASRAITGNNVSMPVRSVSWAILINLLLTPMLVSTVYRDKVIERYIRRITRGRRILARVLNKLSHAKDTKYRRKKIKFPFRVIDHKFRN